MDYYADFMIIAVRFSKEKHTHHIDAVRVLKWQGGIYVQIDELQPANQVIFNIENGISYHTSTKQDGFFRDGAKVIVEIINGIKYLTTVPNGRISDNLDNLPQIFITF